MFRTGLRLSRRLRLRRAMLERLESRCLLTSAPWQADPVPEPAWFADSGAKIINASAQPAIDRTLDFVGPKQSLTSDWVVQLTASAAAEVRDLDSIDRLLSEADIEFETLRGLGVPGLVHVRSLTASQSDVEQLLSHSPWVAGFKLNSYFSATAIPNDSDFGNQFGLLNAGQFGWQAGADIDARQAWDVTTGSWSVVVGVIDSGIDATHPDLYRNIWINQGEILPSLKAQLVDIDQDQRITFHDLNSPDNASLVRDLNANGYIDAQDLLADSFWTDGLDTEGNGFVDDIFGWNFRPEESLVANNPADISGHGTHVAGIIGASGNNGLGVAGVNWQTSLMSLRFLDQNNQGDMASAIAAINYAVMMRTQFDTNVRVLNASWGAAGSPVVELQDAIQAAAAADILVVAAVGNGNVLGVGIDNDRVPFYPASYPVENVVAVAASNGNDQLAAFSNFGPASVDLAAPGVGIRSTLPNSQYGEANGTSMAAPMVSGAAALIWSALPRASMAEVRQALIESVDIVPGLTSVATGGRLNAAAALAARTFAPTASLTQATPVTTAGIAEQEIVVTYTDRNGIDLDSLGDDDVQIQRRWGLNELLPARLKPGSIAANNDRTSVSATYIVAPPGGSWDVFDFGSYSVISLAGSVVSSNSRLGTRAETLGNFRVQIQAEHVLYVDALNDLPTTQSGLSLRRALAIANADPQQTYTIVLESGRYRLDTPYVADPEFMFGGSASAACAGSSTTPLWSNASTGDLDVLGNVTIVGSQAETTLIDAQGTDRVLKVHASASLTLQRLTITGGRTPEGQDGGGILSAGELILDQVTVRDNRAGNNTNLVAHGGGIAAWSDQVQIRQSHVTGNTAAIGGGVFACGDAGLTITRSTIDSNTGGGITSYSQTDSSIDSSTISKNIGSAIDSLARALPGLSGSSLSPAISRDGSHLAFLSSSTDLVSGDTNKQIDAFVFSINDQSIERLSISSSSQQANAATESLAISGDGRQLAFLTEAGNLSAGDNQQTADVFLRDRPAGSTSLVSTSGSTARVARGQVATSSDGRLVAYQQFPSDAQATGWNVFIADRQSSTIERVNLSLAGGGTADIGFLDQLAMSADGRYLVISAGQSGSANLRFHPIYLYDRQDRSLTLVPARPAGAPANGSMYSATISDDGRYIAFASDDTGLVSGDTNGAADIFVYDRVNQLTQRVSLSSANIQANLASSQPSISGNGRYVAFTSLANNLVSDDTNNLSDVFVVDRSTGQLELLSQAAGGPASNGRSYAPSISSDGQRVAFVSTANNLVAAHPNHRLAVQDQRAAVYWIDRGTRLVQSASRFMQPSTLNVTHSTVAFNTSPTTVSGNVTLSNSLLAGNSTEFDFGPLFYSRGYNLYATSSNDARIDPRDIRNSTAADYLTELTSLDNQPPGYQLLQGSPAIDAGDPQTSGRLDQWQRQRSVPDIGALEAVSGSLSGFVFVDLNRNGVRDSNEPGLAAEQVYLDLNRDGLYQRSEPTTTTSAADDVHGAGYYQFDHLQPKEHVVRLVVPQRWLLTTPATERAGQGSTQGNGASTNPVFGTSGQALAFVSAASNLVSGDTAGENIFVYEHATGMLEKVPVDGPNLKLFALLGDQDQWVLLGNDSGIFLFDRRTQGLQPISVSDSGLLANAHSDWASASEGARWIVYSSFGNNLVSGDTDNLADVFLWDRQSGKVISLSQRVIGVVGNNHSEWPVISQDGDTIAWVSLASNLVPGDTNGLTDIFVYRQSTQSIQRLTLGPGGVESNGFSFPPKLSGNGNFVLFQSRATNLVANDTNGADDLFVFDLTTSKLERLEIPFKASPQSFNYAANISDDGQYVTFNASRSSLDSQLATESENIFVYDRFWTPQAATERLQLVSQPPSSASANERNANGNSRSASFSKRGREIVFQSLASNLVPGDTNQQSDIFIAVNPFEAASQTVTLQVGEQLAGNDYPLTPLPGLIAGVLFDDLNEDLTYNVGDPGLSGWTVYLDNNFNGRRDAGEPSTTSQADGSYRLDAVPTQRDLGLAVEVPAAWQPATNNSQPVRLFLPAGGQSLQRHFAFRLKATTGQSQNGKIEGRAFQDLNRDGVPQAGEAGLAGIEVYLDLNENGVRDADEPRKPTDGQGNYSFPNLGVRNYVVRATLPEGTSLTSPLGNRFTTSTTAASSDAVALANPQALVASDLDGIHGPDLVMAFFNGNSLIVQLNNGQGQFPRSLRVPLPAGDVGPLALASGQLNNRAGLDMVVANASSGTISILMDFQGQDFAQKATLTVDKTVSLRGLALADIDNDGDLDLLAMTGDAAITGTVRTFFNNGFGQFSRGGSFSTQGSYPLSLVTGDFNRDGRIDLAVGNFGSGPTTSSIAVLQGKADNTFAAAVLYSPGSSPTDLDVGDLNGDGWLDLVAINYNANTATILQGSNTGVFSSLPQAVSVPPSAFQVKLGDVDGDGDRDMLVASLSGSNVAIIRNQSTRVGVGPISFEPPESFAVGQFTVGAKVSLATADLNADGALDMALINGNQTSAKVLSNRIVAGANRVSQNGTSLIAGQNFGLRQEILLPKLDAITGPVALLEDPGPQTLVLSGISKGRSTSAQVRITASSNSAALPLQRQYLVNSATWTIDFEPTVNASGDVIIAIEVRDPGFDQQWDTADDGVITRNHALTITAVNDAPAFEVIGNQVITIGSALRNTPGFAKEFRPGGGDDEVSQSIAEYIVSNDRPELFLVQPMIDNLGTLRFQPRTQTGLANVTVQVRDTGGTLLGGVDRSIAKTFQISITDLADGAIDFGDAPASYPVTIQSDGARHEIDGLYLGAAVDAEAVGQASSTATGDDAALDDEDGVQFVLPPLAMENQPTLASLVAQVTSSSSIGGKIDAWIDFNRDGDWSDSGEQILASAPVQAGSNLLSFTVPARSTPGVTFARIRLSEAGGLQPTGLASGGEVEDYAITIVSGTDVPALAFSTEQVGTHTWLLSDGQLSLVARGTTLYSAPASRVSEIRAMASGGNELYTIGNPNQNMQGQLTSEATTGQVSLLLSGQAHNLGLLTLNAFRGVDRVQLNATSPQTLQLSPADLARLGSTTTIVVSLAGDDSLQSTSSWTIVDRQAPAGSLRHLFSSGTNQLWVESTSPWKNAFSPHDVNADGTITPLDVLLVINYLNRQSSGGQLPSFDPNQPLAEQFADVNGDNSLTPIDALLIINRLNEDS